MSKVDTTILNYIYKSRNIILSQLESRGFDISEYTNFKYSDIKSLQTNDELDMDFEKEDMKVYIKYYFTKKLTSDAIYNIVSEIFDDEILDKTTDELIILTKSDPNDTSIKLLNKLYENSKYYINIINMNQLQFNVLTHSLVGKNEKIIGKELADFLEYYNIKEPWNEMKEISRYDPVSMALGLRPGDICKTTRNGPTSGYEIDYRYVKNKVHFKKK
jgi:DNA-directed RNA polymerase subunit H (RpoH/RPB5)